ncbi:hypothetical protein AB0E77_09625 [Streptomyces sp. NPDC032940]|uniref:hypothetical protein n=1 Tax=Streptomyces sp. NPDC032940 TaxID=3155366 RepID=UPI0033C91471
MPLSPSRARPNWRGKSVAPGRESAVTYSCRASARRPAAAQVLPSRIRTSISSPALVCRVSAAGARRCVSIAERSLPSRCSTVARRDRLAACSGRSSASTARSAARRSKSLAPQFAEAAHVVGHAAGSPC